MNLIYNYDTNFDGVINPEDDLDEDHYNDWVELCDLNDDGTLDLCDVLMCVIETENAYRAEHNPGYGKLICPFDCPPPTDCAIW